jgi:Protein of unknown function (DUF3987)
VYSSATLTEPTQPSSGVLTEPTQPGSVGSVSVALRGVLTLSLSPSARSRLSRLRAEQEPRLARGEDLRPIADWIARHAGRAARIAGLLHLIAHSPETPISDDTMRRALLIADYLLEHSIAALSTPDELTRNAVDWLRRNGAEVVSQRDLHRGPLGGRATAEKASSLALALVELGALRPQVDVKGPTPGRNPSPSFVVNPNLRITK